MLTNIAEYRITAELVNGERWTEVDTPSDLPPLRFRVRPGCTSGHPDQDVWRHWNYPELPHFPHEERLLPSRCHARSDVTRPARPRHQLWLPAGSPQRKAQLFPALRSRPPSGTARRLTGVPVFAQGARREERCDTRSHIRRVRPCLADGHPVRGLPGYRLGMRGGPRPGAWPCGPGEPEQRDRHHDTNQDIYALAHRVPETLFLVDESSSRSAGSHPSSAC
jgi:hypothetical protein